MELAIVFPGGDDPQKKIDWMLENEISILEMGPDFFTQNTDNIIESSMDSLRKYGISVRSVHAPFGGDNNLSHQIPEKRQNTIHTHQELLRKLGVGGVEILVIHPGVGGNFAEDEMDNMNEMAIDSIFHLIEAAKSAGVKLALENMLPNHPGYKIWHITDAIKRVNSPWLKICFDSGHAHVCGNMQESMEAFGRDIITIHMQDNDGTRDMHLQPPYGTTDWKAFVKTLEKIKYQEPITLETRPWTNASYRQMFREVFALLESPYYQSQPPAEWHGNITNLSYRCQKCGHFIFKKGEKWSCNCWNS